MTYSVLAAQRGLMTPDQIRIWLRVIRDAALVVFGSAIIIVQLWRNLQTGEPPNATWLAFAAFLFGLVPAFRFDEWLFRGKNGNGNGNGDNGAPRKNGKT